MFKNAIIADDHPVVRMGMKLAIESEGHATVVAEAGSPDELWDLLNSKPCDLVVTDFAMPVGNRPDGETMVLDLLRRFPEVPIVVVTMFAHTETLKALLEAGVSAIVAKAASIEDLPRAIIAANLGKTFFSAALREAAEQDSLMLGNSSRGLTPRERDVLRLLATGKTVSEIAAQLNRTVSTISRQKGNAMRRLGIDTDAALFAYLRDHGVSL